MSVAKQSRADGRPDEESARTKRDKVFTVLRNFGSSGATANDVADVLKWDPYVVRPRITELVQAGAVVETGERRVNRLGKLVTVYAVPSGDGQRRLF